MVAPAGASLYVIVSRRRSKSSHNQTCKRSKQPDAALVVATSDSSQAPHTLVAQSRQPSGAEPIGVPHLHLTPKQDQAPADSSCLHSQACAGTVEFQLCGSVACTHTGVSVCSISALNTQTVLHPDAGESDLTQALRELQQEQAQQQHLSAIPHDASQAVQMAPSKAVVSQQTAAHEQQPYANLQSQPILQDASSAVQARTGCTIGQAGDEQQYKKQEDDSDFQKSLQPKQGTSQLGKAQYTQHGMSKPAAGSATTVLGVRANGVHALNEAQVSS